MRNGVVIAVINHEMFMVLIGDLKLDGTQKARDTRPILVLTLYVEITITQARRKGVIWFEYIFGIKVKFSMFDIFFLEESDN